VAPPSSNSLAIAKRSRLIAIVSGDWLVRPRVVSSKLKSRGMPARIIALTRAASCFTIAACNSSWRARVAFCSEDRTGSPRESTLRDCARATDEASTRHATTAKCALPIRDMMANVALNRRDASSACGESVLKRLLALALQLDSQFPP